ncbi:hypothetical protein Q3W71_01175 [Micromonospora sp. C28SCA-DRY-2]|uniref:hypothetical protein n=1 Tax=Micromonospora sp. C28SCA-DRY-2 TaxID=3059522 RepID=UPI002676D6FF|nr:hypothetical protein [Micromonospora sp. C28SCA-DRY-2]MDO3700293.1 hypothetical protein [Micromonospora sp. C28SCA-DRY-2]
MRELLPPKIMEPTNLLLREGPAMPTHGSATTATPTAIVAPSPATADAPASVRTASVLWMIAIAAGVFETVLAVVGLFAEGPVSPAEIVVGVGVRLVVFVVAGYLAVRLSQGRNWARLALALLLGVFGSLSLLIDPIQWLLDGNELSSAFADVTLMELLFATSRIVHLGAVGAAMVSMFRPGANVYFRAVTQ